MPKVAVSIGRLWGTLLTSGPSTGTARWYRSGSYATEIPAACGRTEVRCPRRVIRLSAVIALSGGPSDAAIVRLALEVARPNRAELIAVHVVELDWTQPLDADVAERSEEAQQVLDAAEGIADQLHCKIESVLVQARDVGAAIVDEAVARKADLLILGLSYRTRLGGDFAIGRTIPYALKNAPCAIWVLRQPKGEEPQ
jgi:nucleotide-binding universal stress UspA family protein